jgi:hypothetical protein
MRVSVKFIALICLSLGSTLIGCLDPYEPPTANTDTDFLVIDGFINSTDSLATVKLSRAVNLSAESEFPMEIGATVVIEDDAGNADLLTTSVPGVYTLKKYFNADYRYRLRITAQLKEYTSEYITIQKNTPIDSLGLGIYDDKVEIYASTHDFSEGIKYYRYAFDETYEYTADFFSFFKLAIDNDGLAPFRMPNEFIYKCWKTVPSKAILTVSTQNLSENRISEFAIQKISKGDSRLWYNYSMLVKQMALTKEAYEYWEAIKKVSESSGGLFDPIPYAVKGNIISVSDDQEVVLGYFSGSQVNKSRITFGDKDLPNDFFGIAPTSCKEDYIPIWELHTLLGKDVNLTSAQFALTTIVGYYYTIPACSDCRTKGGVNVKPDFIN